MKSKIREMLILVMAFLALLICYLMTMPASLQKEPSASDSTVNSPIFDIAADHIQTITWSLDGDSLGITREGDSWMVMNGSGLRAMKDMADGIAEYLSAVSPVRVIGKEGDPESYGLSEPQGKIRIVSDDGAEAELYVGKKLSSGGYYVCDPEGVVYVVSGDAFAICSLSFVDIAVKEYVPQILNKERITIATASSEFIAENLGVQKEYTCSSHYVWYTDDEGTLRPLDTIRVENLISSVTNIKFVSIVSTASRPVMTEPDVSLTVEGTDKAYTILFKNSGDGYYYCMFKDSPVVYLTEDTVPSALMSASYEGLRPEDPYSLDWSSVTKLEVRFEGKRKIIEKDADSEPLDELRSYLEQIVSSAQWDGTGDYHDEIIGFTFYRDSEFFPEVELAFYAFNDELSLVSFNGETRQLVSIYAAEGVIELAGRL